MDSPTSKINVERSNESSLCFLSSSSPQFVLYTCMHGTLVPQQHSRHDHHIIISRYGSMTSQAKGSLVGRVPWCCGVAVWQSTSRNRNPDGAENGGVRGHQTEWGTVFREIKACSESKSEGEGCWWNGWDRFLPLVFRGASESLHEEIEESKDFCGCGDGFCFLRCPPNWPRLLKCCVEQLETWKNVFFTVLS